jgi:hypothetical protein
MKKTSSRAIWLLLGILMMTELLVAQEARKPPSDWAGASELWLQRQITPNPMVPDPDPGRRRLLLSFDVSPEKSPFIFHRSWTYDDALAALAFLTAGEKDRAAFTLHALARLVRPDGSLWFTYNTRDDWPLEADHESALVRAGTVGWVGYALTFYLKHQPPCSDNRGCTRERGLFLATAVRLGQYLLTQQVNDPSDPRDGLLRLGYGTITLAYSAKTENVIEIYQDEPATGISTENNISAWFFLRQLGELTGEVRWSQAAERMKRGLLQTLWNDSLGQFSQGFDSAGALDSARALDCASWGALFLLAAGETEKARRALEVIEHYFASRDGGAKGYRPYFDLPIYVNPEVGRFYFPHKPRKEWRELPLVWSEGTLGVALANLRMGQVERAQQVVMGLGPLKQENGGLRCASLELPYEMSKAPCAAASAWLVLVTEALARNPLAEQMWQ